MALEIQPFLFHFTDRANARNDESRNAVQAHTVAGVESGLLKVVTFLVHRVKWDNQYTQCLK